METTKGALGVSKDNPGYYQCLTQRGNLFEAGLTELHTRQTVAYYDACLRAKNKAGIRPGLMVSEYQTRLVGAPEAEWVEPDPLREVVDRDVMSDGDSDAAIVEKGVGVLLADEPSGDSGGDRQQPRKRRRVDGGEAPEQPRVVGCEVLFASDDDVDNVEDHRGSPARENQGAEIGDSEAEAEAAAAVEGAQFSDEHVARMAEADYPTSIWGSRSGSRRCAREVLAVCHTGVWSSAARTGGEGTTGAPRLVARAACSGALALLASAPLRQRASWGAGWLQLSAARLAHPTCSTSRLRRMWRPSSGRKAC